MQSQRHYDRIQDGFDYADESWNDEDDESTKGMMCRLLMTGLPLDDVSDVDVKELFEHSLGRGSVQNAKILCDSTGLSLGIALVTLTRFGDLKRAIGCFEGKLMDQKNKVHIHFVVNPTLPLPRSVASIIPPSSPAGASRNGQSNAPYTASSSAFGTSSFGRQGAGLNSRMTVAPVAEAVGSARPSIKLETPRGPRAPPTGPSTTRVPSQPAKAAKTTAAPAAASLKSRVLGGPGGKTPPLDKSTKPGKAGEKALLGRLDVRLSDRIAVTPSKSTNHPKAAQLEQRLKSDPKLQARVKQQQQQQLQGQAQRPQAKRAATAPAAPKTQPPPPTAAAKAKPKTQAELDEELKMLARRRKFEAGGGSSAMDTS